MTIIRICGVIKSKNIENVNMNITQEIKYIVLHEYLQNCVNVIGVDVLCSVINIYFFLFYRTEQRLRESVLVWIFYNIYIILI